MEAIDVAISFDTTGSMAPCLAQVRRKVKETVKELFASIPNLRVAIMAHGDYCDGKAVLTILDFSTDEGKICKFVETVQSTHGGDADEAYELVLNRARTLTWASKTNRAFVLIGDAKPHEVGYTYKDIRNDIDWKNEVELLVEMGVNIYPIQALDSYSANKFYDKLADISKTPKLELHQFNDINDILKAIVYGRGGKLEEFEKSIQKRGNVSYCVSTTLDRLAGRKAVVKKKADLNTVSPSRFQILDVDEDCDIKSFVVDNDLLFNVGRGFYEFTKPVKVQSYKEVIIQDRKTGEMFTGEKARKLLGIPVGVDAKVSPTILKEYRGFIQSTSNNRKLLAGTKFLYEVDTTR